MYRVLIVDDEPSVFEGLNLIINWADLGYHPPACAIDCEEAFKRLEEDKYHLIITDIRMPGMNGLELLREIRKISPEIRVLILSGYEKFDYAKAALKYGASDYLLKPVDRHELRDCLKRMKTELDREISEKSSVRRNMLAGKKAFFYNLVCGLFTDDELRQKALEYNMTFRNTDCCVALCETPDDRAEPDRRVDASHAWRRVEKLIEEIAVGRKLGEVYVDADERIGIILFRDRGSHTGDEPERSLLSICDEVENRTGKRLAIGYGGWVDSLGNLKYSRQNAVLALDRRYRKEEKRVYTYDDPATVRNSLQLLDWRIEPLIDAVQCSETDKIKKQLDSLANEMKGKLLSPEQVACILSDVVLTLNSAAKNASGDPEPLIGEQEIGQAAVSLGSPDAACEWMLHKCNKASGYIQQCVSEKRKLKEINQAKKYIDEHYSENLSVKRISDMFYRNSAYFGRLFVKTTGESIIDYINRKRISEVKKMVASGDELIHDAIGKAGFNNQGYFYKKFRCYEGISFAEYNQSLKAARQKPPGD